uniref:Cytoplasmic polyadenylation element binding protein 4 n=1 Tax=Callorhinchus milii TaxID=7868 RepID=A0A4W3ILD3_CALMI
MGDYGFGLLVQTNNTNSKVAFPVRYHQPHQQQHSQSATAAAGFCSAAAAAVTGSAWLFPASAAQTMQDDLLLSEKSKSQQQQQQQQLSPRLDQAASEAVILPESPKSEEENQSIGNGGGASVSTSNCKDKLRMESPILSGFDYHEPPSGLGGAGTSGGAPSLTSTSSLTGFSNWSAAMTPPTMSEDNFFHQGVPAASPNGTMLFQNFPHHVSSGFGGSYSPQMALSHYQSPSGGGVGVWGGSQGRDHRRGMAGGMAALNSISPMKKPFPGGHIPAHKFSRSSTAFPPKSWMEDGMLRNDNILPFQDRTRLYDTLNMHSLESSLIDIMRAEQDPLKGRLNYTHPGSDSPLPINGHSSLFPVEDSFLDDGRGDQSLHSGLNSPHCFPHQNGERVERYSRKVFVGGLPPDIDEDEITASFRRFGSLVVDWPHKAESKSYFPPKGYAFLLFQEEGSVQALIDACIEEDGKLYLCVSSPTIKDKPVQIRPWNLNDSDFVMDGSQPLDPRKTIFVGGVPRPLRAVELAMIMDRLYGGVCYAGIDTDPELKYPKGAGRVAFSNQQSYIAAISARFVQLQHGDIDKRVEVKPYVLDDQLCDECQGTRCGGKFAPFFCANVTCLQYYCEYCWAAIHSRAGREFHKPLVKEGGDRPRQVPFRWN